MCVLVRTLQGDDVSDVAAIHRLSFERQLLSEEWITASCAAFPRTLCFVGQVDGRVSGYVIWTQKSGFREEAVVELEQIAVHPERRNRGIGQLLIKQSLSQVCAHLADRGATLKHVIVTTRADNTAQALYEKALGAKIEVMIRSLYSADEVIMVAREPNKFVVPSPSNA